MEIRKTQQKDLPQLMMVIYDARRYMHANNIPQWINGYPDQAVIENDMQQGYSYVLVDDEQVVATACIMDVRDPNYTYITQGQWLNDDDYIVIHRIAVLDGYKGKQLAGMFIEHAEKTACIKRIRNLRIDTHECNYPMRRFIEKCGFQMCGIVFMHDGSERIAYQKVL